MANISPEEILANAMAPVSAAVNSYGEGQVNLAQQQFMNQLRQEAEARKNQYELGQITLAGDIRGRNDLATEAERNRGALGQIAARARAELDNKLTLGPIEHSNKLDEIDAQARAYVAHMTEADRQKTKQAYLAKGFIQAPNEADGDFILRVNKAAAGRVDHFNDLIAKNEQAAQEALHEEKLRLDGIARKNALAEWATTLDSTGKRLLRGENGVPPKTPEEIIAAEKNRDKQANMRETFSEIMTRQAEKSRALMDPEVRRYVDDIKLANGHHETARAKIMGDKDFEGAVQYVKDPEPIAPFRTTQQKVDEVFGIGVKTPPPSPTGKGVIDPNKVLGGVQLPSPSAGTQPNPSAVLQLPQLSPPDQGGSTLTPAGQAAVNRYAHDPATAKKIALTDIASQIEAAFYDPSYGGVGRGTPIGKLMNIPEASMTPRTAALMRIYKEAAGVTPQDVIGMPQRVRFAPPQAIPAPSPTPDFFSSPQLQPY